MEKKYTVKKLILIKGEDVEKLHNFVKNELKLDYINEMYLYVGSLAASIVTNRQVSLIVVNQLIGRILEFELVQQESLNPNMMEEPSKKM